MKKVFIFLIILASTNGYAQLNRIKDGSFEDTTNVWQLYSGEGTLHQWHSLTKDLYVNRWDLLSTLRQLDTLIFKLPKNQFFNQYPKYGNNSSVITIVNYESINWPIKRSVMRGNLHNKLVIGKQYCATLFVNAFEYRSMLATNGVALYFDNGQLDTIVSVHHDSSGIYTFVKPQVQCSFLINDTTNWMKVQGVFTANGTEEYITIGNFLSDSATWQVNNGFGVSGNGQEINIDNVSLIPLDITKWLPTTYITANADSVWVGLDAFDYADGKWYTSNMQYITTGPGFWLKGGSIEAGKKFIHEIDVCGVLRYDTTEVVVAPVAISNEQFAMNNLQVLPNPASDVIVVSNVVGSKVGLYNTVGQLVLVQNAVQNKVSMQVGHLPKGVYVVKAGGQVGRLLLK
jgi:Secretion system C-terminal sorting domain